MTDTGGTNRRVDELQGPEGRMPALGFGTWALEGETCRRAVEHALELGYRHVDTAESYGNEEAIGDALRRSHVERQDVFLVTKVWHDHLDAPGVRRALEASLSRLGTDYVDLLLIHWPSSRGVPLAETLGAMAEARDAGRTRHVGVSNFTVALIEQARDCSPAPIFCNQVEYHPYLSQEPVLDCCRANGILVVAYCPLARGRVFDDPALTEIGERYGKGPGQVALRWLLQQPGVGAIPRSGSAEHIRENFEVCDFELSEEDMARIFALERGERRVGGMGSGAPSWDT